MTGEQPQGLLAWSQAERPDVALFIASGLLSNPSKDYQHDYELNNWPPFRIMYWERSAFERIATARNWRRPQGSPEVAGFPRARN